MWRPVAEKFENRLVHLVLDLIIKFHGCTHWFFSTTPSSMRFFFSFFKHTFSAVARQLASVSLNTLATEGSDFNQIIAQKHCTVWGHPATLLWNNIGCLAAALNVTFAVQVEFRTPEHNWIRTATQGLCWLSAYQVWVSYSFRTTFISNASWGRMGGIFKEQATRTYIHRAVNNLTHVIVLQPVIHDNCFEIHYSFALQSESKLWDKLSENLRSSDYTPVANMYLIVRESHKSYVINLYGRELRRTVRHLDNTRPQVSQNGVCSQSLCGWLPHILFHLLAMKTYNFTSLWAH
jgi:hypothetical protein